MPSAPRLGGGHVILLGVSTRRVENLAAAMGDTGLSNSQVSAMAAELKELVDGFRDRWLDGGPVYLRLD